MGNKRKGEAKIQEMERLEELKREMLAKTFYREDIPEEVTEVIQEAFDGILDRYKKLHCNNLNIQEYIEGKLAEVESDITKKLGEKRKNSQMEQVQFIIHGMERELEDLDESLEDEKRSQERHKEEIRQIEPEDEKVKERIIEIVEDALTNVQSAQNRILDANGFSMDRIEQIRQNVREFIQEFVSINRGDKGKIYEILRNDNTALSEQLLSIYKNYLLQDRSTEEKNEIGQDKKSKREEFVEGLDGGITLEEQRAFSLEQKRKMEKELEQKQEEQGEQVEGLPTDLII